MIRTIPLNKLVTSPRNVRRKIDEQADRQLKADIEARGLLQNLVVTSARKPRGKFAVEAGERRRRALRSLAEEGKLAKDFGVCCLVVEGEAASQEASLAENFQRLAMNPADECLAFQQLLEQGANAEEIARRFGLTVRFVEGRLRLASLAPVIFEALGAGEISLDVAKAYAATPDRERQEWAFEQMSCGFGAAHPDSVRRMMTQATVGAGDRRALFVGKAAYVAAGGRIEHDLFSDERSARWLDVALVERLACEKMEALAAETAAETGLGFVRPTLDSWVGYSQLDGLRRVAVETPPLTDEETARIEALEREVEDLVRQLEDEEVEEATRERAETEIREINDRIEAVCDKRPVIDDELKPQVGAFLILDDRGRARLDTGLYREVANVADTGDAATGEGDAHFAPAPAPRKAAGLSRRLVDELAMQRRDILAAHIAADSALALDLTIFLMLDREGGEKSGSSLVASPPGEPIFGFETPGAAAAVARKEAAEALDSSWSEGETRAARFEAFCALPDEARAAWLGHAVAATIEASLNLAGERACRFHEHLGRRLGIDVARWWRPTGANYFDRVPKSAMLAALEEVGGSALSSRYAKARKAELAEACERIFAGDFIGQAEVKEAALAWVPHAMRFAEAPLVNAGPEVPDATDATGPTDGIERGESVEGPDASVEAIEEAA